VLAAACVLALLTCVDRGFERIRSRPPVSPVPAGATAVVIPLRNVDRLAGQPVAVVLRLRAGDVATRFSVALDGTAIADASIPAGRERRIDAAGYLAAAPSHTVAITADRPGWRVPYLEVANVHGFSRGLVEFVIVPRDRQPATFPWWMALAAGAVLLLLRPDPDWPRGRTARRVHKAAMAIALLIFAAGAASRFVSPYGIILSPGTFVVLACLLYAEALHRVGRIVAPPVWRVVQPRLRYVPHLVVVALVLWSVGRMHRPKTGFTTLIIFGAAFEPSKLPVLRDVPHWVEPGAGYDGQFYAQLALDPLLRTDAIADALDTPSYRARRILLPWIAHVLGRGDPWWTLQAYSLLNVASWALLALLLLRWLPPGSGRATLAWSACLLGEGLLASMRQSVPDGPSVLFMAAGIVALERGRGWGAAAALGLAGLARETNLLATAILMPVPPSRRPLAVAAARAAVAVAPLLLWGLHLWTRGYAPEEAGMRNFNVPLASYVTKWAVTIEDLGRHGWESYARFSLLTLVGLTTQAIFVAWLRDWRSAWWRLGAAYALFMLVLGDAVWEGHPAAVGRILLPMTVAFNVLLPRVRWALFLPLLVLGNASVVVGLDAMKVPWLSGP
jgi:hypothetical protein